MHCLLLGNGLNRLSMQTDWVTLLHQLIDKNGLTGIVQYHERKPLSLLFEELCAQLPGKFLDNEIKVKAIIGEMLVDIPPSHLHQQFAEQFHVILTTNYDFAIEKALSESLYSHAPSPVEKRYSLFRKTVVGTREVWHIHGTKDRPESILLGYDHYAGSLQKVRNYITTGIDIGRPQRRIGTKINSHDHDFENGPDPYSWTDHFLRDHVHIVGLGLDFTEIDLWWLLLHKRRRLNQTGLTFFYHVHIEGDENIAAAQQVSALTSLGIRVHPVTALTYEQGYEKILGEMKKNIKSYPTRLARVTRPRRRRHDDSMEPVAPATRPKQRKLRL
jgi:hypothetical protein